MSAALSARASEVLALQHLPDAEIMTQLGMTAGAVRLYRTELRRGGAAVTVTIDPLAELFPAVTGADFDALVADIRAHGLREKIVRSGLAVLDGRNRFRACIAAGLFENPVPMAALGQYFRPLRADEGDPLAFVLSANLTRRHLTESQRAMVAARLATLGHGGARRGVGFQAANLPVETAPGGIANTPHPNPLPAHAGRGDAPFQAANLRLETGLSSQQAADALHVSTRSIETARHVLASAAPELVAAVEAGDVSLHAAESLVERPHAEQTEIVARGRDEILKAAKQFRAETQAEKARKRAEKEATLGEKITGSNAALAAIGAAGKRYGVVLADPEWQFHQWSDATGMDRAPDNHYPCSPLETIMARPVADLAARDCALFLWVPASMMPEGLAVLAAWGFAYASQIIWDKQRIGLGRWVRTRHEVLLIGKRGDIPCPAEGDQWESVQQSPRAAHSEKPEWAYRLIEAYFPTLPKLEMNARIARAGWDVWGAEAPGIEVCHVI